MVKQVIIILLSFTSVYSQNDNYSIKNKENIKEIDIRCYDVTEEDGHIIKGKSKIIYDEDTVDSDITFDINGNKTSEIQVESPGLINRYKYDSKNNLIEKTTTNFNKDYIYTRVFLLQDSLILKENFYKGNSKQKITETIFKYDKNNNNISKENFNKVGRKLWEIINNYDQNNNKIKKTHYEKDKSIYESITYEYSTKGNLIKYIKSRPKYNVNTKFVYQYDDNNNQIKLDEYGSDGKLNFINKYYYNKKNKLIKREEFDSEEGLIRVVYIKYDKFDSIIEEKAYYTSTDSSIETSFDYLYDSNKNWISKTKYLKNEPKYIIERKIEYYK